MHLLAFCPAAASACQASTLDDMALAAEVYAAAYMCFNPTALPDDVGRASDSDDEAIDRADAVALRADQMALLKDICDAVTAADSVGVQVRRTVYPAWCSSGRCCRVLPLFIRLSCSLHAPCGRSASQSLADARMMSGVFISVYGVPVRSSCCSRKACARSPSATTSCCARWSRRRPSRRSLTTRRRPMSRPRSTTPVDPGRHRAPSLRRWRACRPSLRWQPD